MESSKFPRILPFLMALVLTACFGLGACGGSNQVDSGDAGMIEQDSSGSSDTGMVADAIVTDRIASDMVPTADAEASTDAAVTSCLLPVAGTLNLPTSTVMGTLR